MPDSLYLQTFDQCGLNLFLLARFIPDGVLLIFPYLFIPSGSDQFVPCVVRLLSSLHQAHQTLRSPGASSGDALLEPLVRSHRDQIPLPCPRPAWLSLRLR
jgi:hypothetical protein